MNYTENLLDHFFDGQVVALEKRGIARFDEGSHGSIPIRFIPTFLILENLVIRHRLPLFRKFQKTPFRPLRIAGGQEELDLRIWKNRRAHIPSLQHDPALSADLPLNPQQSGANLGVFGHRRCAQADLRVSNLIPDFFSI